MKVKSFFKSTAFKCIVVLLAIVLVCGAFLTICDSLFEVTSQERLERAVAKIYDGTVTPTSYGEYSSKNSYKLDDAEIQGVYKVTGTSSKGEAINDYLVLSMGKGGNAGGTVTCYVPVQMSADFSKISGIGNVRVSSNEKQDFITDVTSNTSYINSFAENYVDGIIYDTQGGYLTTGATKTSNALNNAVNGAISFVKTEILKQVVAANPIDSFKYVELVYTKNNYTTFEAAEDNAVKFNITTQGAKDADAFTIEVVVSSDKTIKSYVITGNGANSGYEYSVENNSATFYAAVEGKNEAQILTMIGSTDGSANSNYNKDAMEIIFTGATQANYLCLSGALFAVANYDNAIAALAQGGNS